MCIYHFRNHFLGRSKTEKLLYFRRRYFGTLLSILLVALFNLSFTFMFLFLCVFVSCGGLPRSTIVTSPLNLRRFWQLFRVVWFCDSGVIQINVLSCQNSKLLNHRRNFVELFFWIYLRYHENHHTLISLQQL